MSARASRQGPVRRSNGFLPRLLTIPMVLWVLLVACGAESAGTTTTIPSTTSAPAIVTSSSITVMTTTSPTTTMVLEGLEGALALIEASEYAEHSGSVSQVILAQADAILKPYLAEHPDDVEALILSARLGRLQLDQGPTAVAPGDADPFLASVEAAKPVHALLDRAIELDPDNAEAHYWKARLYGTNHLSIEDDILNMKAADIEQAIQHATKAVELAPETIAYREALAIYFAEVYRFDEALAAVDSVPSHDSPIFMILDELAQIPIPEGAVFSESDAVSFADFEVGRGSFFDFEDVRVRAYIVAATGADLRDLYRDTWPSFEWCLSEGPDEDGLSTYIGTFTPEVGGLEPVSADECPDETQGIVVALFEWLDAPTEALENAFPGGLPRNVSAELVSILFLSHHRPS